jgi:hypothetical protein
MRPVATYQRSIALGAVLAAAVSLTSLVAPGWAAAWQRVTYHDPGYSPDIDTTRIEAAWINLAPQHTLIRVCVDQRPIHIRGADVLYSDKSSKHVQVRAVVRSGTCTRDVQLRRKIDTIILYYDRPPARAPIVKVYAR